MAVMSLIYWFFAGLILIVVGMSGEVHTGTYLDGLPDC